MNIDDYGWNEHFEREWKESGVNGEKMFPGRVIADYGQMLRVAANAGEILVNRPVQKLDEDMQVAVGDWVALEYAAGGDVVYLRFVLVRMTKFSRAAAGIAVKEQVVAANVDYVFLMQSLNKDFNMRRLERYLIVAWESEAIPVIVLTKADCCENVPEKIAIVNETAPGVKNHSISCVTGEGVEEIGKYLVRGRTIALLGSSGVGKSTLVNALAGEELLKTRTIREHDSRGRHTTTHREIVLLSSGALILDTPGMRSLSPWEADRGMEIMFGDIEGLTKRCRFLDCSHFNEPGCAVQEALNNGELQMQRWESWLKLHKEMAHLEAKQEGTLRLKEKQLGRQYAKIKKEIFKGRK